MIPFNANRHSVFLMILVTGAAGFIGSNLVAFLNETGRDDLVLCDWLGNDGRWQNLRKRFFAHMLSPEQLMDFLTEEGSGSIDCVVHLGAISDTSATDGDLIIRRNYQYTKELWRWCASHGAIFVYASSASTYGDGSEGFSDQLQFAQTKKLRPLNLYGWSKHIFDLFALSTSRDIPKKWYGIKLFNVFGPNEYHKGAMRSVLCKLAPRIIAGETVQLFQSHRSDFADGAQERDFVDVADACSALLHFAKGDADSGIYNVGTGRSRSFADIVSAAFEAFGHAPRIEYVPMPTEIRESYQYHTQADTTKLRASGFTENFSSLEASVANYMLNYLAAKDRYR